MRQSLVQLLSAAALLSLYALVFSPPAWADVPGYRAEALAHPNIYHYYSIENAAQPGEDTAPVPDLDKLHLIEEGYTGPFGVPDTSVHIPNIVYEQSDLAGETSRVITPYNAKAESDGINDDGAALISPGVAMFGDFQIPEQMTLATIVKFSDVSGHEFFALSGGRGIQRGNFIYQESNSLGFGTWNGGGPPMGDPGREPIVNAIQDNWYFVAVRLDYSGIFEVSGSFRYANLTAGDTSLSDSSLFNGDLSNFPIPDTRLAVGMHNNPDWACFCSIDEVSIFDTLLTDEELDNHYSALAGSSSNPGDLDGDGDGDGNDILLGQLDSAAAVALAEGNFGTPALSGVASVPEPTSSLLALCGLLLIGRSRRRG